MISGVIGKLYLSPAIIMIIFPSAVTFYMIQIVLYMFL